MGILISSANFKGRFAIAQDAFSNLDLFINQTEEQYLKDLLGAQLYSLFKADLSGQTPQAARFLAIYNPINQDTDCGDTIVSDGMVTMLKAFVYFDYSRNNPFKNTVQGIVKNDPDTSQSQLKGNLYQYQNEGVKNYQAIQEYIFLNQSTYPEFRGKKKSLSIPFF